MDAWVGKVAVVTGANSGIGLEVAKQLLQDGLTVVALDIHLDTIQELCDKEICGGKLHIRCVDLSIEADVVEAFKWIDTDLGGPDILLNIAGIGGTTRLLDGTMSEWQKLLSVNVLGVCLSCQLAARSMIQRSLDNAHIINLSSNTTWYTPKEGFLHFYTATKHAVRSLTQSFRLELLETNVKVSCISPALVKTGIFSSSLGERGDEMIYSSLPHLQAQDVASCIRYVLSCPAHVQIGELNIKHQKSLV